jgi:hypothetical protein
MSKLTHVTKSVLAVLLLIAIITSLISYSLIDSDNVKSWVISWLQNLSTEIIGALITYLLLNLIVEGYNKRQESEQKRKEAQLHGYTRIMQAKGPEEKQLILNEMERLNLLQGADLRGADLVGVFLAGMNLQEVNLSLAQLRGADLSGAQLQAANLSHADLAGANLKGAELQRTKLIKTKFTHSTLVGARLSESIIEETDFRGANLQGADFSRSSLNRPMVDADTVTPKGLHFLPGTDVNSSLDPS